MSKKFKYSAYSTISALCIVTMLVSVNLAATRLDIRKDLTQDKMYSLSEDSIGVLRGLETDVTIYAIFKTGEENPLYKELLEQYRANSPRVKLEYKDPYLQPQFANRYASEGQNIGENSIILEGPERHKVILAEELMTTEFDYNSFQEVITSIDLEPQVTNGILYVTGSSTPVIYMVKNHGEEGLPDLIAKQLRLANYELRDLDLLREEKIPEDCDILLAATPERDWTKQEAEKVRAFLEDDGRALFLTDSLITSGTLDNLNGILNSYGVSIGAGYVIEGDKGNYYNNYPPYLVPNYLTHEITQPIIDRGYIMLLTPATSLDILDTQKEGLTIEPLLSTSDEAYARVDFANDSLGKIESDLSGPFTLAAAVTDSTYTTAGQTTKLVVVSCGQLLSEAINVEINGTNGDFILQSVNWLNDSDDKIYISSKTGTSVSPIVMTTATEDLVFYFSVIGLPALIICTGLYVWFKRRYS